MADGADAGSGAGAGAGAGGGTGAGAAQTSWHNGAIDADTLGFFQIKGLDATDPVKLVKGMTEQYRNAESLRGVPANELIRMPKPNAAESDVKAFWSAVGVPAEAKEYDFSQVKRADGKEIEASFSDTMRSLLHNGRVPKDRASDIVNGLVKYMESSDAAVAAERTAYVQKQQADLKTNWGPANFDANMVIARSALTNLGAKAGMNADQAMKAWDALSKVGGVDASLAMEILRVAGVAMGEARYISSGHGGDPALLSREAAKHEIDALKRDESFRSRLMSGDRESRRKWDNLHEVAFGKVA